MSIDIARLNPTAGAIFFAEQASKFGAWGSDSLACNFWYLNPGQQLVPSKAETTDTILVVLDGDVALETFEGSEIPLDKVYRPEAARVVSPAPKSEGYTILRSELGRAGDVFAVPMGLFFAIVNGSDTPATVLSVSAPVRDRAQYTSR
ncbi:cupin domain-containing protein [Ensifer adhaerens]|uniref:cupin domain-containing protein n=1 Tax=Ensifer adhaerens TaxID=106592 RepID=UPI000CF17DDB|nr:cupin domain-containing protein [Ensifer adhaerens]